MEDKKIIKRVKVPTQKWTMVVLIIMSILFIILGIITGIQYNSISVGALIAGFGVLLLLLALLPVRKNIKLYIAANTYPEDAIIVGEDSINIITDTSNLIKFADIKSVRGIRWIGTGIFTYNIYFYGTLFIKLKNGKKITLIGIDNVVEVANMLKTKIN